MIERRCPVVGRTRPGAAHDKTMPTLELTSSARLRDVASQMRTSDPVSRVTAPLLEKAADSYDAMVASITAPSRGIDEPAAMFHGDVETAYAYADVHFFNELALARVWADTRPTGTGGAR